MPCASASMLRAIQLWPVSHSSRNTRKGREKAHKFCETKGINQRWHFLGVQCNFCHGFNTTVDETVMTGQEAADFLGPPPPPPSSSDFSAAGVDHNVLAVLMDHGGEVLAENGLAGDASMEADEFDPNIAAEVLSYVNSANNANNGSDQSMAEDMEEDENEEWH